MNEIMREEIDDDLRYCMLSLVDVGGT